jgi:hypothetical protein
MSSFRRAILSATSLLALSLACPARAQEATPQGGDIIVTGTRDAHRTAQQSLSPITVIGAETLAATGQTDLRDALTQIAPSVSRQVMGLDQGSLVDALSLRGLSADQTLVLVNGKRRHTTALLNFNPGPQQGTTPVDLDLIPTSAVERIEVLQDGASAQYGSDAIAGVINIILKGQDHGFSAQSLNGSTYHGDGFTTGNPCPRASAWAARAMCRPAWRWSTRTAPTAADPIRAPACQTIRPSVPRRPRASRWGSTRPIRSATMWKPMAMPPMPIATRNAGPTAACPPACRRFIRVAISRSKHWARMISASRWACAGIIWRAGTGI